MNRRERILAASVGALVLLTLLNFGVKKIVGQFTDRHEQIQRLNTDLESKQLIVHRGTVAQRSLKVYNERSLPSNPMMASSRYRAWLHEWVEKADITAANVKHVRVSPYQQSHDRHTFNVTCDATLPQLVDLLFRFYSTDYLHRIRDFVAKPSEGKFLTLNFTLEAISMPDVAEDRELRALAAQRLVFDTVEDYQTVIVNRNPYAPANLPPKFTSSDSHSGHVNQPLSVTLKAEDPEKSAVRFRVEKSEIEGLSMDESSGRIEWTPSNTGEFELQVVAMDDGIPSKETSQTLRITVTDAPPEEAPPPRRSFDEAKYTFVTGIVEVNGRRQVWLTVRSQGKWLRLFEGETFQVGEFEGTIVKIYPRHVEIQSRDSVVAVRYGQSISEGEVIRESGTVAASAE
ncbi:MAG: cadherin repeat domain-containing protein [Pirellulaceae bacterium]